MKNTKRNCDLWKYWATLAWQDISKPLPDFLFPHYKIVDQWGRKIVKPVTSGKTIRWRFF